MSSAGCWQPQIALVEKEERRQRVRKTSKRSVSLDFRIALQVDILTTEVAASDNRIGMEAKYAYPSEKKG